MDDVVWRKRIGETLLSLAEGSGMQRDDDYMRQMMLDIEATDAWFFEGPYLHDSAPPEEQKRSYHLLLLVDAGMVCRVEGDVFRLTSAAHDFLDRVRERDAWAVVKEKSRMMGGAGVSMLGRIAEAIVVQKLRDIGLPM